MKKQFDSALRLLAAIMKDKLTGDQEKERAKLVGMLIEDGLTIKDIRKFYPGLLGERVASCQCHYWHTTPWTYTYTQPQVLQPAITWNTTSNV